MKFNSKEFFELAKQNKLSAADVFIKNKHSVSVSVYHEKVDSVTENESSLIVARGILNGKFGSCSTEVIDKNTNKFLMDGIVRTASVIENDDPAIIYKGSEKYHKKSYFNKSLLNINIEEKTRILLEIEKKLYAYDKRINDVVGVSFEENDDESRLLNSYGLKLSEKNSNYSFAAEVTAKQGGEIRSGYKFFVSMDEDEFDIDKFVKDVAEDVLSKLGATQCETKKYPIILNPECASSLLKFLVSSLDAEEVQKHTSLLEGKLHQQVLSKKLTIIEDPFKKSVFYSNFDDEGVATKKKYLIKKGEIETYLYTLQTAAKDNVEPTGNGSRVGSKATAETSLIVVKPGRKSEEELISSIKEGIYINDLQGLHSGMNAQSGNFSLQSSGKMIRNGKLCESLTLITIAGNLLEIFNNIKDIANNSELVVRNSAVCPSILIKKMAVSGK